MWKAFCFSPVTLMGQGKLQDKGWLGPGDHSHGKGDWARRHDAGKRGRPRWGFIPSVCPFIRSFVHSLFHSANIYRCPFSRRVSAGHRENGSTKQPLPSRNLEAKTGNHSLFSKFVLSTEPWRNSRKGVRQNLSSQSLRATGGGHIH